MNQELELNGINRTKLSVELWSQPVASDGPPSAVLDDTIANADAQ